MFNILVGGMHAVVGCEYGRSYCSRNTFASVPLRPAPACPCALTCCVVTPCVRRSWVQDLDVACADATSKNCGGSSAYWKALQPHRKLDAVCVCVV